MHGWPRRESVLAVLHEACVGRAQKQLSWASSCLSPRIQLPLYTALYTLGLCFEVAVTTYQLPFRQAHPIQLAPTVRELQSQGGIHRVRTAVGHEAWLVTDYTQVRRLLDDDRLGRSHPRPETAARAGESALFGGPLGNFDTEAADHARMRALLQPHFAPKHMRTLIPKVEALTTGLLDDVDAEGPPADLHAKLALPLPILVICELLGVPYSDRGQFRRWTRDAANVCDHARSEQGLAELY